MEGEFVKIGDWLYVRNADVKNFVRSLDWHRIEGHCCMACEKDSGGRTRTMWPTSEEGLLGFFQHYVDRHDGLKKFQDFMKK